MKAIKPHTSFIPNMGSVSLMEFDLAMIEKYCPFLCVDDQGRRGTEPVWMAGRNAKRMRATFRDRPAILITSIGPEEEHRWKDAVTTGPEMQAWIDSGTAQGLRAWFTKFNGVVPDTRWIEPVAESFGLAARIEPAIENTVPVAEIAILDPTTTLRHHDHVSRRQAEAHDLGFYHALVEARLPFELLSDGAMTDAALDRFRVVILCNSTCLSEDQAKMLERYVARGGALVVAHETGTRTPDNEKREAPLLADLLGYTVTSPARGPVKNTYVAINGEHPIAAGFDGAGRIMGGTHLIGVEAAPDTVSPFLFVPDFPDLPMEEVYPREDPRGAAVVAREHEGGGRSVYIPFNIGAIFWEVMAADHGRLIANCVRWALGKPSDVTLEGPGIVDICVREGEGATVVLLNNLTNPMMMKGPIREVMPVGPLTVSLKLPEGATGAEARLAGAGTGVPVSVTGGRARVTLDSLATLEAIEINWR